MFNARLFCVTRLRISPISAVLSRAFLSFQRAPKFTRNNRPIMMRRAPNPYLSFLPMLMTFPQELAAVARARPSFLVVAVLELHRLGGFFLCFLKLPAFHRVDGGVDEQRRTANHLGALYAAVLIDHDLQLDGASHVHPSGKLGIHRIHP